MDSGFDVDRIYHESCLDTLGNMPDGFLDCVVTSPPYWALRDYGSEAITVWDGNGECSHEWQNLEGLEQKAKGGKHGRNARVGANKNDNVNFRDHKVKYNICQKCGAWKGALGLEPSFELYIKHLCDIFDEVRRVLKKEGTVWVNIGDTYLGNSGGMGKTDKARATGGQPKFSNIANRTLDFIQNKQTQLPNKLLSMIPFRFAIEMIDRGWILRNVIIWHKPNCMPSSAKDRFTVDFEYLFFFTKSGRYWFEQQFENHKRDFSDEGGGWEKGKYKPKKDTAWKNDSLMKRGTKQVFYFNPLGRNKRCVWTFQNEPIAILGDLARKINDFKEAYPEIDEGWFDDLINEIYTDNFTSSVWEIPTRPFPEAHFAVYPEGLIETPIRAGCPEFICKRCGKARKKIYRKTGNLIGMGGHRSKTAEHLGVSPTSSLLTKKVQEKEFVEYSDCGCGEGFSPGIVYDPFLGAGTTAVVAKKLGRYYMGSEMNADYIQLAEGRLKKVVREVKKEKKQMGISFN